MKEYKIKHFEVTNYAIKSGVTGLLLAIILCAVFGLASYAIAVLPLSTNFVVVLLILVIFLFVGTAIFVVYLSNKRDHEKYGRLINIVINDECININNGERYIYFNTIFDLQLNEVKFFDPSIGDFVKPSSEIIVLYNLSDKFRLCLIDGVDKKNEDIFYDFYSDLNEKYQKYNTKCSNIDI
ncbi:MAG: hypothetical protein FWC36_06095 [Spirochaetes bacterium]|nr:hypothetical protein [Spirochaetota bacterium]